ncbi:TolC family protein [Puia sp. P3]|uniref:TolC family protein n=1 Tax=Puia sp. P3 TaxID=3423952 RepID=UPI003D66DE4C
MFLRLSVFTIFGLGLLATTACAQDSATRQLPTRWDLQTCLDYAKKNNIQLNSLRLTARTAQQNYLLSRAQREPNLQAGAGLTYTHSKNANPVVGGFQTQSSFSNSLSLSSGMTLYNGGYISNDIKQKNLEIESANLNILQTENDITLSITQAYLAILLAKENVVYVQDLVTTSMAQVDQGRKQYEAGSIARNAYIELQAQMATDKYNFVTAQNAVRTNKITLKQLLQLSITDSFDIVTPDTVMSKEAVPALDQVVATALRDRPEIKNGELGIEISRYDLLKARAAYLPILTASANLSSGYSNNQHDDYFKQLDNNFFQQAGLSLSIPIFNRRVAKTNVENAKIEIEQSQLNLKNVQTSLALTIEQAYINVVNAQGQYDAAVEGLRANQESFRIAGEQLKVGAANIVDYLQQKTQYTQAFQVYIQAKYNAALSIRIYDFYMGIAVKL